MKTRAEALAEGYTIDDHGPGRPIAYKGPRFNTTALCSIHTDLEVDLMEHIVKLNQRVEDLENQVIELGEREPLPEEFDK